MSSDLVTDLTSDLDLGDPDSPMSVTTASIWPPRVPYDEGTVVLVQIAGSGGAGLSIGVKFNGVSSPWVVRSSAGYNYLLAYLPPGTEGETVSVQAVEDGVGGSTLAAAITRTASTGTSRIYHRYPPDDGSVPVVTGYGSFCNPSKAAAVLAGKTWLPSGSAGSPFSTLYAAGLCKATANSSAWSIGANALAASTGRLWVLIGQLRYPLAGFTTLPSGPWGIRGGGQAALAGHGERLRFSWYVERSSTGSKIGTIYDDTLDESNPGPVGFVLDSSNRNVNFDVAGSAVYGIQDGDDLVIEVWEIVEATSGSYYYGKWLFGGTTDVGANGTVQSGRPASCLIAPRRLTAPLVSPTSSTALAASALLYAAAGETTDGLDISTFPDLDPTFTLMSGRKVVAEAILRRLSTRRGSLLDSPDYGLDLRDWLNRRVGPNDSYALTASVEAECEKDERVLSCSASVTFAPSRQALAVTLALELADGPYSLVLGISDAAATILSQG